MTRKEIADGKLSNRGQQGTNYPYLTFTTQYEQSVKYRGRLTFSYVQMSPIMNCTLREDPIPVQLQFMLTSTH